MSGRGAGRPDQGDGPGPAAEGLDERRDPRLRDRHLLLETLGKRFLFSEPLAKTGSADKAQINGKSVWSTGPENAHGKITGVTTGPGGEW